MKIKLAHQKGQGRPSRGEGDTLSVKSSALPDFWTCFHRLPYSFHKAGGFQRKGVKAQRRKDDFFHFRPSPQTASLVQQTNFAPWPFTAICQNHV
jgi:hypothetical protein